MDKIFRATIIILLLAAAFAIYIFAASHSFAAESRLEALAEASGNHCLAPGGLSQSEWDYHMRLYPAEYADCLGKL